MTVLGFFVLSFFLLWAVVHHVLPMAWRAAGSTLGGAIRLLRRHPWFDRWYRRGSGRLQPAFAQLPVAVLGTALALAALTGFAFMELAEAVSAKAPRLERLDDAVWQAAPQFRGPAATRLFYSLSMMGRGVSLGALTLSACAVLLYRGERRWAWYLFVTAAGSLVLNEALKALFARARPDLAVALWEAGGYSFPSGHAMGSLAVLGALAYLAVHMTRRWRVRSALVSLALLLVAAISLSRIYLGVHWLSDVVGGLAAGTVWLAATSTVHALLEARERRRARAS